MQVPRSLSLSLNQPSQKECQNQDGMGWSYRELAAIIKIDEKRNKRFRRSGHASEAENNKEPECL